MRNSSRCKHIINRGCRKGNNLWKIIGKKDFLCHKHRYRFLQWINNIYSNFKYLFHVNTLIIKDKSRIKKYISKPEKEQLEIIKQKQNQENIKNKYITELIKIEKENYYTYVDRLEVLTKKLIEKYPNEVNSIFNIITKYIHDNINGNLGSKIWCDCSNYYLKKIRRPYFYN